MTVQPATAVPRHAHAEQDVAGARPGWRAVIAGLGLAALLGGVTFIVLVAATRSTFLVTTSHHGYPHWMAGPLQGLLKAFHPNRAQLKVEFTALMGGMYLAYLLVLATVPSLRARWLIGAIVALHAVLFLSPPLSLTDVFNYIHYGRMGALHGLNPYAVLPVDAPHSDPAYRLSNWHHLLSPYGPLFTLVTYALAPLGVPTAFWVLKGLLTAASLGTIGLVWRCARVLERDPRLPVAIVALNPLVLIWGLGGDHSDAFVVLTLMGALLALLVRREGVAGALAVVALGLKASAAVVVPALLAAAPRKLRALAGVAVAGVVVAAGTYAAFGTHLPNLSTQSKLVAAVSLPNLFGLALGQGGQTDTLRTILTACLAAVVIGAAVQSWRGRDASTAAGVAALASLVLLAWVLPWYLLLVLPFAALSRSRTLRAGTLVIGVWLILSWMPLLTDLIHSVGFHPSATPLGREHKELSVQLRH